MSPAAFMCESPCQSREAQTCRINLAPWSPGHGANQPHHQHFITMDYMQITANLPPIVLPEKDAARHVGGMDSLQMLRTNFDLIVALPARGRQGNRYDRTALEAAWKRYYLSKKPK